MEPDPPPVSWIATSPKPAAPAGSRVYLLGFIPLALFVFLAIAAPGFFAPMIDTTVPTGGASLGIPLLLLTAGLMLAGVLVMRRFPTVLGVAVGLIVFTFASLLLVIIGPAICLIAQNMYV